MTRAAQNLPTVTEVFNLDDWSGAVADYITLDYDGRHRRRIVLTSDNGTRFLLDLPQSRLLSGGTVLKLDDGRLIEIIARPETLLEVRATDGAALLRLAWHIGNRHLAADLRPDRILIRYDAVVGVMLRGLGAVLHAVEAPFDPEGGAYGDAHQGHHHDTSSPQDRGTHGDDQ